MKSATVQPFIMTGMMLVLLMTISMYFYVVDPNRAKSSLKMAQSNKGIVPALAENIDTNTSNVSVSTENLLSAGAGDITLETFASGQIRMPIAINSGTKTCSTEVLRTAQISEIVPGITPRSFEYVKVIDCI